MPRRGGSSSRNSSPARNTHTAQAPTKQPAPVPHVQPHPPVQAQPQSGGFLSGMAGTFVTGMALGAGSEVAHQTIRGFMGGSSNHEAAPQQNAKPVENQQQVQQKPQACENESQRFIQCFKDYSDVGMCQNYGDMLKECQKKYGI